MIPLSVQRILDQLLAQATTTRGSTIGGSSIDAAQLEERVLFSAAPVPMEGLVDAGSDDLLIPTAHDTEVDATGSSSESVAQADSDTPADVRRELVFVDAAAENYQQLVDDLLNNQDTDREIEVVLLDSTHDGIEQISGVLATYSDLDAIHLVSHGSDGEIKLGKTWLTIDKLDAYAGQIATWNSSLRSGADLLIYGCDLASNEAGQTLTEALGALCDCDVAASVDDTGHAAFGGDWDLEYATGSIETSVAFSLDTQQSWAGLLAVETLRDEFNSVSYSNNDGSVTWTNDWQEIFEANGPSGGLITVSTELGEQGLVIRSWDMGAWREANLSGAASAFLSFDFARISLEDPTEYIAIEVSGNGGGAWTELDRFEGPADDTALQYVSYDITPYIASNTQIRFVASNANEGNDKFIADNVEIMYSTAPALIVNTTQDNVDGDTTSIATLLGNNPDGLITLREAIEATNGTGGLDLIRFDIPGGSHTIAPGSALPMIISPVIIDGRSEPDFAGTPIIELDGLGAGGGISGLEIGVGGGGSTIRGLVINRFDDAGILIHDVDGNTIEGNYLGTDVTGTLDPGFMDNGIRLENSDNNNIGGDTAAARNVISGNNLSGVNIQGGSDSNAVKGNYIGTTFDGTSARSNFNGVYILDSSNNTIGGNTAGSRNIISGNNDEGVEIQGSTSSGNAVLGNYIGTDVTGTIGIGNAGDGVLLEHAPSNTIGGTTAAERNIISGSGGNGIHIGGTNATLNSIQGNYIGTNWDGTTDIANQGDGVRIDDSAEAASTGAAGNLIGGATPGARNVISGNDGSGIVLSGFGTDFNRVQGNYIGTNAAGTAAIQNDKWGIIIVFDADNNVVGTDGDGTDDATEGNLISGNNWEGISIQTADFTKVAGNYIGTDAAGTGAIGNSSGVWITGGSDNNLVGTDGDGTSDVLERNVISGNDSRGVRFSGTATLNTVAGNYIGLDALGTGPLGNNGHGVRMNSSVGGNTIGGISAIHGNTIAYNTGDGVAVANGSGNRIRMNEIYANGELGIDLMGGTEDVFGVTSNDSLDPDPGPNNLQNIAILTAATISGSDLTVTGALNSTPNTAFDFDFFASATADPSDHGEAERYIGSALGISTVGSGNLTLNETLFGAGVSVGEYITVTATDQFGNTSEFALNVIATGPNSPPTATDNENAITEDAVAPVGGNVITDNDGFGVDSDPELDPINVKQIDAVTDPAIDVIGAYGTLNWDTGGDYSYTIDNGNAAVQALGVGETLADVFTYTIDDGGTGTDTATLTITITGTNDDPTADNDATAIGEDAGATNITATLLAGDTDPDTNDVLAISAVDTTGTVGSVTLVAGVVSYDPNGQFESLAVGETATDTFTYTIDDGNGGTDTATVTVTINGANDDPTADDDATAIGEDAGATNITATLLAGDTDPDTNDVLAISAVDTTGTVGSVTLVAGVVSYDPNGQFESLAVGQTAIDTFSYTIDDGNGGTDTATVTVTINGANDNPTADNDAVSVNEDDGAANITATLLTGDTDPDTTDVLAITAVDTTGTVGTVTLVAGVVSYDPNGQFESLAVGETATDTFTYTIDDGNGGTDTATVTVTINGANDDPTTDDDATTIGEDAGATNITATLLTGDTDPDSTDMLAISAVDTTGTVGTVTLLAGVVSYNPNGQFESLAVGETATDTFSYTIDDGNGGTDTATVTVTINGANDNPTADNDAVSVNEDDGAANVTATLLTGDTDPDTTDVLAITAVDTTGTVGTVTLVAGVVSYDPNGQFESLAVGETATDTFTYTIDDGNGGTDTATVTVTINGQNDDPVAVADSGALFSTDKATPFTTGNALANDSDPDTSDVPVVTGIDVTGTLGLVTDNGDGTFGYDPNGQFAGLGPTDTATDTFTYTIDDGNGGTDTATVTITIVGLNNPPIAVADSGTGFIGSEDSAFTTGDVLGNDSDPDLHALSVLSIDTTGTLGTIVDNGNGTFDYDPAGQFENLAAGATATDTFIYTIDDGNGATDTATVTIRIDGSNDAPVANPDVAGVLEGGTVNIDLAGNDTDADDGIDPASISIVSGPSNGTLVINTDGTVDYTHNGSETTTDGFTYRIRDVGGTNSNVAAVDITINPQNDPPVAGNDSYSVNVDNTLVVNVASGVQDNDSDAENDPLNTMVVTGPANGVVVLNSDGSFTYTPDAGFSGTDSFTYKANDGSLDSNDARVTIEVKLPAPGPDVDPDPDPEPEEEEETSEDPLPPSTPPTVDPDPPPSITPPTPTTVVSGGDDGAPTLLLVDEPEQEDGELSDLLLDFGRPDIRDPRYLTPAAQLVEVFTEFTEAISLDGAFEFFQQLDSLDDLLKSELVIANVTAGSAGVISLGLSAGYAFVTIRAGYLVTSLLTSMPAWRVVDPLPVLAYLNDEDEDDLDDIEKSESLESIVANAGIEG